jgi:integrase
LPGYYVLWQEWLGGRRRCRSRNFLRQRDARRWCREFNARQDLAVLDDIIPISLAEAGREFLRGCSQLAPDTVIQYGVAIKALGECLGNITVHTISRSEIDNFLVVRSTKNAEATVAKHLRHLSRFFQWCINARYLELNPIRIVTSRPRQGIVRTKPRVNTEEFARLLKYLNNDDRKLAVLIAATTGLDRGVIAGLTASDVDLERRQFCVVRRKTGKIVRPAIHDELLASIAARIRRTSSGQPLLRGLSREAAHRDWWKRACRAAGVPQLRFVDLRTYAVNWLREAVGDFEAQHAVGHSSPAVTARHYYQASPLVQQRVSSRPLPGSPSPSPATSTTTGGSSEGSNGL